MGTEDKIKLLTKICFEYDIRDKGEMSIITYLVELTDKMIREEKIDMEIAIKGLADAVKCVKEIKK